MHFHSFHSDNGPNEKKWFSWTCAASLHAKSVLWNFFSIVARLHYKMTMDVRLLHHFTYQLIIISFVLISRPFSLSRFSASCSLLTALQQNEKWMTKCIRKLRCQRALSASPEHISHGKNERKKIASNSASTRIRKHCVINLFMKKVETKTTIKPQHCLRLNQVKRLFHLDKKTISFSRFGKITFLLV